MAAALAEGTTVIENAAREPEITDLAVFLRAMGANISGDGTPKIVIEGVSSLTSASTLLCATVLRVVLYLVAAMASHGEVLCKHPAIDLRSCYCQA